MKFFFNLCILILFFLITGCGGGSPNKDNNNESNEAAVSFEFLSSTPTSESFELSLNPSIKLNFSKGLTWSS